MSENNQDTTPQVRPRRRIKRRLSKTRLPTPPPNPLSESFQQPKTPTEKNANFFDIDAVEMSPNVLHKSNLDPLFAPVIATDQAFDHLDKLYKLMDQWLNLRQQNARIHKRLRDLQYLKNLRNFHQQYRNPDAFKDLSVLDDDPVFEGIEVFLSERKREPEKKSQGFRQSIMKKPRNRSSSLNGNATNINSDDLQNRRQSSTITDRNKTAKVSKWTKVKAAFKWEKASPSVSGAKSQDSGLGIMVPMNYEVARYLRVPSNSDDHTGISTGDSGAAEGSSQGSLSSASSADDIHHSEYHNPIINDIYYKESAKISPNSKKRKKLNNPGNNFFDNVFNDESKTDVSDCEEHSRSINSSYLEDSLKSDISKTEIPKDVAKYNSVVVQDETANKQKSTPKRVSKWVKVKNAFLTPTLIHTKTSSSTGRSFGICKEFHFAKTEDESHKVQTEIERNYQELRHRIYREFDEKYPELRDSISSNSTGGSTGADGGAKEDKIPSCTNARYKGQSNKPRESIQMLKENLAPEFKKKLEEWEKFKKHNAKDDLTLVTKTKKKLGEWPKWKSVSSQKHDHNDPQPSTSKSKKLKDQDLVRQLQWFETELKNIEKEKQNLELERQQFIQREERLAKLRRTVVNNGNKKDILIHTPSGCYKFEGISREFTQKLCEWEKAQGIKPEESTFALLSSSFTPNITVDACESDIRSTEHSNINNLRLIRSKSAESVAVSNLIEPCSSAAHHPSSLSLNDVDELEKECFSYSENSSAQDIYSSLDKFQNDEPEAVIVEFEDVVEETASPLEFLEEKHFPVYQREKTLSICDNNLQITPCVQVVNSSPNNSQYSFYLVEESLNLLKSITNDENMECGFLAENYSGIIQHSGGVHTPDLIKLQDINETQLRRVNQLIDNLIGLQQMHSKYISDISEEEFISSEIHFHNLLESSQDIFSDLFQMAEHLQTILQNKKFSSSFNFTDCIYSDIIATTSELTSKFSEYKRILTYLDAASDLTAPQAHIKHEKSMEHQSIATCSESEDNFENHQEILNNKRTRFKKKEYYSKQITDEPEYSDLNYNENKNLDLDVNQETTMKNVNSYETLNAKPTTLEKLIIPTKPTTFFENSASEHEPVDIFVKTTKKRFAPIIQVVPTKLESNDEFKPESNLESEEVSSKIQELTFRLPPLPSSPISQRKMSKDISPSIRLMLAKYNQLISEQEGNGSTKSAGSSGSASPVAWRSPVSERRVKAQRDRYLEVVRKNFNGNEVKKSASASILNTEKKDIPSISTTDLTNAYQTKQVRGILRSTSANAIRITNDNIGAENKNSQLKLFIPQKFEESKIPLPSWRNIQIQKAKEEFFNLSEVSAIETTSAPALIERKKQKAINRFSHVSVGSESSCDSSANPGALIKSASAGMIHVDEYTYRNIDPAHHQDGYVTLPRLAQKEKEGFLGGKLSLSNIASKFRKVRMRKNKEKKKMTTVSTLCRQSLTVDINSDNQESVSLTKQNRSDSLTVPENQAASSSDDTSPSSSRSGSWIRRSRIFKAL